MEMKGRGYIVKTNMYDVFISFKHSDASGNKTNDSAIAERLYDFLKNNGVSVFYSPRELEFLGQSQYSKAIDDALDASRFLVAVGCCKENLDSQWVRYEWDGFLGDIRSGVKPNAEVFVVYADMNVSELPRALRQRQAFDANDDSAFDRLLNFMRNAGLGVGVRDVQADELVVPVSSLVNADECYEKGDDYYYGRGVVKDYVKAIEWYRKAAKQGHASAQYDLGFMYHNGYGISKNDTLAIEWYRKAAEQCNANAQNSLGFMYHNGYGVSKDYATAVEWYRKAAEQGQENAQKALNRLSK